MSDPQRPASPDVPSPEQQFRSYASETEPEDHFSDAQEGQSDTDVDENTPDTESGSLEHKVDEMAIKTSSEAQLDRKEIELAIPGGFGDDMMNGSVEDKEEVDGGGADVEVDVDVDEKETAETETEAVEVAKTPAEEKEEPVLAQTEDTTPAEEKEEPVLAQIEDTTPPAMERTASTHSTRSRRSSAVSRHSSTAAPSLEPPAEPEADVEAEEDDDFGDDDFDDFGEEVNGDDFDDFATFEESASPAPAPPQPTPAPAPVPTLDYNDPLALQTVLSQLFPEDPSQIQQDPQDLPSADGGPFLTDRSLSLWSQLHAPPPLSPPNWTLSRTRRLFLVSLGVPVDLDEILPASTKAAKLILPSSTKSRPSSPNRRKTEPEPEALDMNHARILCATSDAKLSGFSEDELREHIERLEEVTRTAGEVLTWWLKGLERARGDKEAFETVIESLVGYARKKRGNG